MARRRPGHRRVIVDRAAEACGLGVATLVPQGGDVEKGENPLHLAFGGMQAGAILELAPIQMANDQTTASDLSFSRQKPRWPASSIGYRMMRLGSRTLGDHRMLPMLLNLSWIAWRLAYESCYRVYGDAFPDESYGVTDELLEKVLPMNGTVLDVGCGSGRLSRLAARHARRVVGIDQDAQRIAAAERDAPDHVRYLVGDVTRNLTDEQFDVAMLAGVLEHIDEPIPLLRALRERARSLIVEVPDVEGDPLNWARRRCGARWYSDNDHVREYSRATLEAQLVEAGWEPHLWHCRGLMVTAVSR